MSRNWAQEACAEHEARYKAAVVASTWGHLAPKPRHKYKGHIVFAKGVYPGENNGVVIDWTFGDLIGGPWFYDDVHDFVSKIVEKKPDGAIYRFDGTYMKCKNGAFRFSGKVLRHRISRKP